MPEAPPPNNTPATVQALSANWSAVFSNKQCVGHIQARGRHGFAALDASDQMIGVFADLKSAADAVSNARSLK